MKKDTNSYGSFVVPLINEKLPTDIRVITARKFKSKVWDLNKMTEVLKLEVEAKKNAHYRYLHYLLIRERILI